MAIPDPLTLNTFSHLPNQTFPLPCTKHSTPTILHAPTQPLQPLTQPSIATINKQQTHSHHGEGGAWLVVRYGVMGAEGGGDLVYWIRIGFGKGQRSVGLDKEGEI